MRDSDRKALNPVLRDKNVYCTRELLVADHPPSKYYGTMNLGLPEMLFIFVIALIIFGPKKLPEIGLQVGRALNEFKRASNEFKAQIESEISQLDVEPPKRTIHPTAVAPDGTVASGDVSPVTGLPVPLPESNPVAKAPDA